MENFDVVLGERYLNGSAFGLFADDRRRGLYIIGQTGVGKSTLLRSMIRQDMEKGRGIVLLDPHGDLADDVLSDVPTHRTRETILVDPSDQENVVAINPFYQVTQSDRAIVTANLVAAFKHIWHDNWSTSRLPYILTNVIAALLDAPDRLRPSLLSIPVVLASARYREQVVAAIENPQVRAFFEGELANWSQRYFDEAVAPVQNRIGQFLVNPILRNMLGQWRPSIDLEDVLRERRILIVRLSKGQIGEEPANLLGSIVLSSIQSAAMRRAAVPEQLRFDVPLYIDEFHTITSDTSATTFAEGRKYGLMLTVANQYLEQLQDEVRAAIFGNAANMLAFRTGATDAREVAEQIGSYEPRNYRDLATGQVYARLLVAGESTDAFRGATIQKVEGSPVRADRIRAWCRDRYCRKRQKVENDLIGWLAQPWVYDREE